MAEKLTCEQLELRVKELEKENKELRRTGDTVRKQGVSAVLHPEDGENITFEELFDIEDIQLIQDQFAKVTGVASIITHTDGTPITAPSNFCRLCQDIIRQTDKGLANCFKSDAVLGQFHPEGPTIQPCMSGGLWDAGAGITIGGKHIANWMMGQVRDERQTEEQMLAYAREIGADTKEVIEAFQDVPAMSLEKFEQIAHFLFILASQLSTTAYQNLQQARFITELEKTEKELQVRKETLKSIFVSAPIGIGMVIDRKMAWINQRLCGMVGYTAEELLHQSSRRLYPDEEEFEWVGRELYEQISAQGTGTVETRWRRKDGELIDVLLSSTPLNQDDWSKGVTFTALDISKRKKAEKALQESEERFRFAFHTSPDSININRLADGAYIDINKGFTRILGYTREDVIGESSLSLNIWKNPDDRKRLVEGLTQKGYVENLEAEFVGKDGKVIVGLMSANIMQINDESVLLSVTRDITERKHIENELKQYRTHLEEMVKIRTEALEAKNKEMETFTYSVSHDLKAPLRGIDGYSRLLEEEYADKLDAEGLLFLKNVRQSTSQMNQLIEDLLAYSRMERRDIQPVSIDLRPMIDILVSHRAHDIEAGHINVSVNLPFQNVHSDIETLRQVLGNYLDNAVKFARRDTSTIIEVGGRENDEAWTLWVKDNGIGFDPQYVDRIFEIFQRLHRVEDFPGTGIGLAIARKAIERIGGRVWAESSPGNGATFFIDIPKAATFQLKEQPPYEQR